VAFTSMRPGPAKIWKGPAAGGTPVQVTRSNGFRGYWSPDGTRIAYDTAILQGSPREGDSVSRLEVLEVSTGKVLWKLSRGFLQSPV
jgi:Tol biopolymer transport system component